MTSEHYKVFLECNHYLTLYILDDLEDLEKCPHCKELKRVTDIKSYIEVFD